MLSKPDKVVGIGGGGLFPPYERGPSGAPDIPTFSNPRKISSQWVTIRKLDVPLNTVEGLK